MPRRYYKFDLYARGVTSTTGTITRTWESSRLAEGQPLIVGGQTVRPTEGRTESEPYTLRIVDVSSTVSSLLTNSSGRNHLLSRLWRVRRATDSTATTAFKTLTVGRVQDVALAADVASYDFTIADERWVERNTEIFTKANTAMLIPPGLISSWATFPANPVPSWKVVNIVGNLVCLRYDGVPGSWSVDPAPLPRSDGIFRTIESDVKPRIILDNTTITEGNFTHLRFRRTSTSTDYELARFGAQVHIANPGNRPSYPRASVPITDNLRGESVTGARDTRQEKLYVWLVWAASQPSLDSYVLGYVYAPTHPPTDDLPLHTGGSSGDHPFSLASKIYGGTFSASTSLTVRKSTAHFDTLTNDPRYGRTWHRITRVWNMAEFLEQRVYQPYCAVPLVNSSGKIAPVSMLLPKSTAFTLASMAKISSTNATIHPTWTHPSREVVNVLRGSVEEYSYVFDPSGNGELAMPADRLVRADPALPRFIPHGFIYVQPPDLVETADTTTTFGRREVTYQYGMLRNAGFQRSTASLFPGSAITSPLFKTIAQSIFGRFADGPIYTDFDCTTGIDATTNGKREPGSFIKVVLATYPNAGANARGSTRIMQIISRRDHPVGVSGTLLDVGPALAALTAPGLTLALSSQSSRHAVKATVSTALPTGARYELQMGFGATTNSTAPTQWRAVENNTTASRTFTLGNIPAHTKVMARVKAMKPTRIDSAFSAVQSVETATIPGPTGFAVSSISAGRATFKWTNGTTSYVTEVLLDATSTATLGSSSRVATVLPPTTRFQALGLNSNDGHKAGVRHADPFGGYSTQSVATFTTTTSYSQAPAMKGLAVVVTL